MKIAGLTRDCRAICWEIMPFIFMESFNCQVNRRISTESRSNSDRLFYQMSVCLGHRMSLHMAHIQKSVYTGSIHMEYTIMWAVQWTDRECRLAPDCFRKTLALIISVDR